jgi:F0F1-type ATP synthase assembly protein I
VKQFATFITIPFAMAVPPVLGWFFGQWLDKKFGTAPFLMYFLIVAGIVAGFREAYRIIKRYGDAS